MDKSDLKTNLQPDLSGNPFLWLEKRRQKDWERRAEIAAIIILINNLSKIKILVQFFNL